jgi:hypothetical protein
MAFITIETGNSLDIGKQFTLEHEIAIIGRASADNNPEIPIHDDYISRHHAEISAQHDGFMLRDLGSKNGTELDGQRLVADQLYQLKNNAIIGLGITPTGALINLRFRESPITATIQVNINDELPLCNWLTIDESRKEVWVDGTLITLARKEFSLLLFLFKRYGQVCSRDDIIANVWPETKDPGAVSDASIDQMIYRLRGKIEPDPSKPSRLLSRKGFGLLLT